MCVISKEKKKIVCTLKESKIQVNESDVIEINENENEEDDMEIRDFNDMEIEEDDDEEEEFVEPVQKPVQKPVRTRQYKTRKGRIKHFFRRLFSTLLTIRIRIL